MGLFESKFLEGDFVEPQWLEKPCYFGLRCWHLGFLGFSGLVCIVVMLCCCFRFRIPRTKQEIEADYQRRVIAKNFRKRLANIKNSEMDDMNLQKERIRQDFLAEAHRNMEAQEMKGVVLRRGHV
ncbi:transmembrane inner ear expressed protein isoform X3 [Sitodiplosis mosellana]|uniref:transmembrane inner ear expressed protein isoform X3 n=1 Tax=Sitodiplosis mosellana TaxID=263140 RepID=UPI00244487ED|nr:transmembrane inner ear expressed protein isoform X3 [Sitodiplosis mosellana]